MSALQTKVCEVIDSSWHFSWHWKKDDIGYLTLEGWKEARRDALGLRASLLRRIQEIEAILPKIEEEIAKRERWAKQDAESMETVP